MTRTKTAATRRQNPQPIAVSIADLAAFYIKNHVNQRVAAPRRQLTALGHVTQHFTGGVADVTPEAVNDYVAKRARSGASPATARRELTALRAVIHYASRHRLIPRGDIPHIDMPPHSAPRGFFLDNAECDALISFALNDRGQDGRLTRAARFVLIVLGTASRRRAVEELRWSLVDFQDRKIRFDLAGGRITKKRRVSVPVSDWLLSALSAMRSEAVNDFVLDTKSEIALEGFLRRAVSATGMPRLGDVYPHALRHTVATLALKSGAPIYDVARLLGDTVETVERVYAHHMPGHCSAAVNWRKA